VSASASRNPAIEKRLGVLIVARYILLCTRWCAAEVQLDCSREIIAVSRYLIYKAQPGIPAMQTWRRSRCRREPPYLEAIEPSSDMSDMIRGLRLPNYLAVRT
jgi:hypothetical protein